MTQIPAEPFHYGYIMQLWIQPASNITELHIHNT